MVDSTWKYLAYDRILEIIKNSTSEDNNNDDKQAISEQITRTTSFENAVRKAYFQNKGVSYYLGYSQLSTRDANYKPPGPLDIGTYNHRMWR